MNPLQYFCEKGVVSFLSRLPEGRIDLTYPDGRVSILGAEKSSLRAELQAVHPRFFIRVALGGNIGLGESFMAGEWTSADLPALLSLLVGLNRVEGYRQFLTWSRWAQFIHAWQHRIRPNSLSGSRRNIGDHYDLSNEFFATFLDPTMVYSCALYDHPGQTLEDAQRRKIQSLLDKLEVTGSDHVLEIGTGWGGFAIEAAKSRGCKVTTITLSREQANLAIKRVTEAGLSDRVDVQICDYRDVKGQFDKIVSIEMIEAVGHKYLPGYFQACDNLLKPGGHVALQVITVPDHRYDSYRKRCDWLQKHIFPGGLCPSLSSLSAAMSSHSQLVIDRVDSIGPHYVKTLQDWRASFSQSTEQIRDLGFNDVFQRKWLYYFAYCEAGFATGQTDDVQLVLSRK